MAYRTRWGVSGRLKCGSGKQALTEDIHTNSEQLLKAVAEDGPGGGTRNISWGKPKTVHGLPMFFFFNCKP